VSFRDLGALAWRESRFARRRLLLFLSSISLGVAALVAVQGFAENLRRAVRQEAQALLGADLLLRSRQPFGPRTEALLDSLRAAGTPVARRTSFASMGFIPATGATRLVQVRAPEAGYPFYGEIVTRPAGAWRQLHAGRHAIVDPAVITTLGAAIGDSLALGDARFRIVGVIDRVPGDTEIASAFAPRVFIPAVHVAATGLVAFGSRVDHEAFLKIPSAATAERLAEEYRSVLRSERVRSETAAEEQQDLERAFGRLTSYLGLVGVLALLLGGIGVASAMTAYMVRKVDTVAVLRCLGATAGQVFAVYLAQAAAMGLVGAAIGVVLGLAVQWVLPTLVSGLLPLQVEVVPSLAAVATGLLIGVWTAVLFAAIPLLAVRRISPLGALRRSVEPLPAPRNDWPRYAAYAGLGASATLFVWLQLREVAMTAAVLAGVAAALAVLWGVAAAASTLLARLPRDGLGYLVRHGIANLHRPSNQTRTVVLALGCGVFLLATLLLSQHNLLLPLRTGDPASRPNLLLWDVQEDQALPLEALLREMGSPVITTAPIVPMRVASLNGEPVRGWTDEASPGEDEPGRDDEPSGWAVRREYRSTFRDELAGSERVVAGRFWNAGDAAPGQVSLERDIAVDLGVELGDSVTWDVQGVMVPTEITSIREVDWARFEPNFFAVFPSSALEAAPRTWVILTRGGSAAERGEIQRAIVRRFPNVAAIDLALVQAALDEVIGKISAVIRFLGAFSIATGFVVLLGAVASGRAQRVRESVLLKTLGATRRQIAGILGTEYLLLGALAALSGTGLATAAGWALARWVFEVPFEVQMRQLLLLGLAVAMAAVVVGLWASRETFRRTPLEAMRQD
jgi:putative ABC transport system permease protein